MEASSPRASACRPCAAAWPRPARRRAESLHANQREHSMASPYIIGWGHTPFGKFDTIDPEQLLRQAIEPALQTAGIESTDIDGIFVGHFNGGFLPQDFSASLVALALPELRHVPAVRTENACATGSSAIWAALDAVEAGRLNRGLGVAFG